MTEFDLCSNVEIFFQLRSSYWVLVAQSLLKHHFFFIFYFLEFRKHFF